MTATRTNRFECPACGNDDPNLIEDNGERRNSPDLTLLCMKPGPDCNGIERDDDRPSVCGCQWNPNDERA